MMALNGKDPKNFAKDDWKDILDNVADYGVMMDPQKHTELVFELFATYIDFSVDINKQCVNETNSKDIKEIASEIRNMTKKLEKYTDAGVREYWIIDPDREKILVFDFEHDDFPVIYTFDDQVPVNIWDGSFRINFPEIRDELRDIYGSLEE